ncbi:MAG: DUF92 domain-containing protein [Candidatus Norongarragalinales archaeon]
MVFSQTTALIGLILNLAIAIYAFKREWLDAGGTVAALTVGFLVFSFGGWTWLALLVFFFASSNVLGSKWVKEKRVPRLEFAKEGVRDFWQVFANGGFAALLAVLYNLYQSPALFAAFLGVIATVTADTWATEIGVLERKPRLVTTLASVRRGTSGAVSKLGLATTFAAGFLIALLIYALDWLGAAVGGAAGVGVSAAFGAPARQFVGGFGLVLLTAFVAVVGSLVDSFFGATIQGVYYCPKCRKETEKRLHKCGTKTKLKRGFAFLDNDAVNLLASLVGAGVAFAAYSLFFP